MTRDEAIKKYTDKFGGFPYFLTMGMSDEELITTIEESLKTGEEIKCIKGRIY